MGSVGLLMVRTWVGSAGVGHMKSDDDWLGGKDMADEVVGGCRKRGGLS